MLMYNNRTSSQSPVRNFKQTTAPSGATPGDLWVDISSALPTYKTLISQFPDIWVPISSGSGGEGGGSIADHGQLTGLGDDDHTQYHNNTRGDVRYYLKSQIDTSLAGKASATHDHTGVYQPAGSYSLSTHNHDATYQPIGSYSLSSHDHDAAYQPIGSYSLTTHDHTGVYQPAGSYSLASHNHDSIYASISHDHTGVYQPAGSYSLTSHNHDSTYQPIGSYSLSSHNHDSSYASITHHHDAAYQPIGSYSLTTHNHDSIYASITHNHDATYQPIGSYSLTSHNHNSTYQPLDSDLTSIAALTGSNGFLKSDGAGTWTIDTTVYQPAGSYLTANQSISISGDGTGSGTTSIPLTLATVNSDVGTYTNATITVDAKGRITAAATGSGGGGGSGTPAGNNKEVQYNNSGSFAGAANVEIDNGDLTLAASSAPVAPAVDNIKIYGNLIGSTGGRVMPSSIEPSGTIYPFQPAIWNRKIATWNPPGQVSTAPGIDGMTTVIVTGTATARAVTTTSVLNRARRLGYVSGSSVGSTCGNSVNVAQYTLGDGNGIGGFFYSCRFGLGDLTHNFDSRTFVGVTSSIASPTNVNPETLTNAIGIGHKEGNTNWYIFYGGSAAQTKIDLGGDFPVNLDDLIELVLWSPPDEDAVVYYQVTRIAASGRFTTGGKVGPGTANVTLPSNTTLLAHRAWRSVTSSGATAIDISSIYFETNW